MPLYSEYEELENAASRKLYRTTSLESRRTFAAYAMNLEHMASAILRFREPYEILRARTSSVGEVLEI